MVSAFNPVSALPSSAIAPDAAFAMPLIARNRLDLPAPLAPRIATSPPVATLIETSRKASTGPYLTLKSLTSSIGGLAQVRGHHLRIAQHVGWRAVRNQLAEVEHDQPVAELRH